MRIEINSPRASDDNQWHLHWGVNGEESYATVGTVREKEEREVAIPVTNNLLPFAVDGMEVHLLPFRIIGDEMHGLLIVIADRRELIKENLRVIDYSQFDWDKSFVPASTFVTSAKQE